jgi:hypothetical protein
MVRPKLSIDAVRDRARRTARGSLPSAGIEPAAPAAGIDSRRRRAVRQRLRRTRSVRRARVVELGVLVADMHGRGRWNERLVDDWVRELDRGDAEQRELERALQGDVAWDDLVARRVVAECPDCGRLGGADDAFCAGCGRATAPRRGDPNSIRGSA